MMRPPERRRDIIHRRALDRELGALPTDLAEDKRRKAVVALLKTALARGRAEIRRRFETGGHGTVAAHAGAYLIDQIIRVLYDDAALRIYPAANPTLSEHLGVVAVGGYGRGELAPASDIDVLFVLPYRKTARCEQIVEHMLYVLWDLGLKVGHATRSLAECIRQARADMTIRTAMLEARYVWGEESLFIDLRRRFQAEVVAGTTPEFVEAKLAERDARHARLGDSRYLLEPNIKDGKGGLRDLHTLFWIAKYAYQADSMATLVDKNVLTAAEAASFAKAHGFLWTLRCHLHYLAERSEERLTFDVQTELARRMGYTDHVGTRGVERLMKHYFLIAKSVGDLTRLFCAALEAEQRRKPPLLKRLWSGWRRDRQGIGLEGERLTIPDTAVFLSDPVNLIRLFWLADQHSVDIHPAALRLIRQNLRLVDAALRRDPEANRLFLEILTSPNDPERALRRMNEAGVFGRFVPDFGRVVAQMQYDMYHVYTVDEHTIFAIGILSRIEHGDLGEALPLATSLMPKLVSRRALFVAILLHDIAKGRGGDHSELGAGIAERMGPRFGLTEEETETTAWLVRHHLLMSNTAFRRDLQDPRTISDFVAVVQSPERLKLLLVLTVADIRAVGPNVWNNWKAGLLRELYHAASALMRVDHAETEDFRAQRLAQVTRELRAELADWSAEEVATHVARGDPAYFLSADAATLARHARMVRRAIQDQAPLAVSTEVSQARGVTELTVYTHDHPGLFAELAGAMAVSGANIVDARIFTLSDGMILDSFSLQDSDGGAFARPERLAKLAVMIEQSLGGHLRQLKDLGGRIAGPSRSRVFKVKPRVLIDDRASQYNTVIEVNGRDRPGLLHDLGAALARLNLQVTAAKISTYGERVVDVFYVKDRFGLKIDQPHRVAEVRRVLTEVLAESDATAAAATPGGIAAE